MMQQEIGLAQPVRLVRGSDTTYWEGTMFPRDPEHLNSTKFIFIAMSGKLPLAVALCLAFTAGAFSQHEQNALIAGTGKVVSGFGNFYHTGLTRDPATEKIFF